ncbi:unnamed protein product [Dicrocoelium dendriticum]|nr:unnamed protein product [Dicrocoelium dendriticum]
MSIFKANRSSKLCYWCILPYQSLTHQATLTAWHMSIRVGNQLVYWLASKRCCSVTPSRTCLHFVLIFAWLLDRFSVVSTEVSIAFLYKETV